LTLGGTDSSHFSKLTCGEDVWLGVVTTSGVSQCSVNLTGYSELHTAANSGSSGNSHFGWGIGSNATVTLSNNSKFVYNGINTWANGGLVDISDGGATAEVTLNDFSIFNVPKGFVVIGGNVLNAAANGAKGSVTLNHSAAFTAGQTVEIGDSLSEGVLNLNGGAFTAPAIVKGAASLASTINFNGGTLMPTIGILTYYDAKAAKTATGITDFIQGAGFTVNVMEGGAKIDSNSLDITISQELKHAGDLEKDGGLTKLGDGSLTLTVTPTYTGDTTVNQGTLTASAGLSTPGAEVFVATGATLNAPSIVADTLTIGGAPRVAAAAVPEPGTFALIAIALTALAGGMCWKRKRTR
jgi:autotransporter-associated beta strand protein